MWEYLSLFLSVSIMLFILIFMIHIKNLMNYEETLTMMPLKRYLLSEEYCNIKSGDILFMRNSITSYQELIIPFIYKHVAIIVEINGKLYIAEASGSEFIAKEKNKLIKNKKCTYIYPLKNELKSIIGPVFLSKLHKPLTDRQNDKLQDTIFCHLHEPYPSLIELYVVSILQIPIKTNMYCFKLIYKCLVNIGLIQQKKMSALELSKFVTSVYKYKLNDNYYEHPRQLIYDLNTNDELY